jgi:hypothetical protein
VWNEGLKAGGFGSQDRDVAEGWRWDSFAFAFALTTRARLMFLARGTAGKRDACGRLGGAVTLLPSRPPNAWLLPCSNHVDQS